ncbi:MarR family winged helix-turn-helix transcriptional regulator [Rhodococcus sp. NPDC058639]|uniref:MarR family winged helix-turn-helix transcriptional regulator n=1 Tax=Rhodococcus sp. NPDC058639 TaxID=3346570 RepID=UPI003655C64C
MSNPERASEPTRELASTLHDLSWSIQRMEPAETVGLKMLPAPDLAVLKTIHERPGRSVSDTAAELAMHPNNVSASVRNLVEEGLVRRTPAPEDKRIIQLHPTAKSLEHQNLIWAAWAQHITDVLDRLAAEDRDRLVAAAPALEALVTELRRFTASG